ncbi:MAG: Fe-S cluster assembly protein SufD [Rhodospirillaceae bacterium]
MSSVTAEVESIPFLDGAPDSDAAGAPWLSDLRAQGLAVYRTRGLPGTKVEAWRYTNLGKLKKIDFKSPDGSASLDVNAMEGLPVLDLAGPRIVLVNGQVDEGLSLLGDLPRGVEVESLAEVLAGSPDTLKGSLGGAPIEELPLAALNTGMLKDGVVIRIAADTSLAMPLHVVSVAVARDEAVVFHPRTVIVMEPGASAVIAESHVTVGEAASFSNGVAEIKVGAGATLKHYKYLGEGAEGHNVASALVDVAENGAYETFSLALSGRLSRNEVRVTLSGEGADGVVSGAYAVREGQHVDNTVLVDHAVPRATSNQFFKGVLDETGRAVFQGKILVRRHAQETDGQQLHNALMLSRGAEVDTKPELEIYADDVKCSHGATCGEMDDNQLFYLMARGLDEDTARALLIEAFLEDVVGSITDEAAQAAFLDRVRVWQKARNGAVWSDV